MNSPPIIVSAAPSPDFDFPGPLTLDRADTRTVTLTFSDNNVDDTLYVRFFTDYATNPPGHQTCGSSQVLPTGEVTRTQEFCIGTWCAPIQATDTGFHTLEVIVADRPFSDAEVPQFRVVSAGGLKSSAVWSISCELEDPP